MSKLLLVVALAVTTLTAQTSLHLPPLDTVLPPRAETIYTTLAPRLDTKTAMVALAAMAPRWRLAGNPDYDRSIDELHGHLTAGGFARSETPAAQGAASWVVSYPNNGHGWSHSRATVAIDGATPQLLLSREQDRVALCINSFSTPPGGVVLPVVDVRGATPADFDRQDVKGALVLGDVAVGALWTRAVRDRGAAGVISTDMARYVRPDETPDVLQWGSIPYDEARRSFGFKSTPRAARALRDALSRGAVRVRVEIESTFHRGENRTLVAEIPGTTRRDERVVLVAHVQEPGANDNASGSATLLAAALAIRDAVARGALPPPARTLTFLWLDEIRGSEQWIAADKARAGRVVAMMSLDMTGQDTSKTGGTFLIEKSPDPSAIWARPSDPHSEWGAGEVDRALVRGHVLNDLHLAVALRRARDTGWVVRTNPYEGGSDHTVFTRAGVAALLNWHFTDRYYHTNLDTLDKTSADTMEHVGVSVATTALFLASADATDLTPLTRLLDEAERARLDTERRNQATEEILTAWRTWYDEARRRLPEIAR